MTLSDILSTRTISVKKRVKNSRELFSEIAELSGNSAGLDRDTKEKIAASLAQRESLATTALGGGTALPHCRVPGLPCFIAGIVTTEKPLEYNAMDNNKVDIFPFIIAPEDKPKEHLKVLSGMARLLRNKETRQTIRKMSTSEELLAFLMGVIGETSEVPHLAVKGMRMLHVFVREEEIFNDILQVFASGETIGAMVMEAHESTEYLSSMPVFAGFWNSELNTFNRIIAAVVKESLLNQTLRSIEYVCGDLSKQQDVMVTVTDLHHVLGSLDL